MKGRPIRGGTPATNASKRKPHTNRKAYMRDIPFKLNQGDTGRKRLRRTGNQDYS